MEDLNLPEIKRKKIQEKNEDKKEFKGLFESDSDSDSGELMQKRKGDIFKFHLHFVFTSSLDLLIHTSCFPFTKSDRKEMSEQLEVKGFVQGHSVFTHRFQTLIHTPVVHFRKSQELIYTGIRGIP